MRTMVPARRDTHIRFAPAHAPHPLPGLRGLIDCELRPDHALSIAHQHACLAKDKRQTPHEHSPANGTADIGPYTVKNTAIALVTHETVSPEIFLDMDVHPSNPVSIAISEKFE